MTFRITINPDNYSLSENALSMFVEEFYAKVIETTPPDKMVEIEFKGESDTEIKENVKEFKRAVESFKK